MHRKDTILLEEAYGKVSELDWLFRVHRTAWNSTFDANHRRRPEFEGVNLKTMGFNPPTIEIGLNDVVQDKVNLNEYYQNNDIEGAIEKLHEVMRQIAAKRDGYER